MGSLKSSSACRRLKEIKQWSIYWVTGLRKAPDSDTNPAPSALPSNLGWASLGLCCALGVKHRSRTLPAPALCHWEHKQLFHFLSAKQHLLQWQLQRPSMTLNNNRKLNQRICRGIQSFPFHHRLQRPFLLQGSQEYAGQWTSPSLQTPALAIPVPTNWGLSSLSFGQVNPQSRSVIWPQVLYPRKYRLSPNFLCIWETRGTVSPPLHPLPSNPSKWQHKKVFRVTVKYFWEELHLCLEWEAALSHLLFLRKVKFHYFLLLIIAIY